MVISLGTFASRILGFFRDVLIARLFGTSFAIESFFIAFSLPNMFRALTGEGAAESVVVPVISEYAENKEKKDFYSACASVIIAAFILLLFLTFLGIVFAPCLVRIIAFGFSKDPE